MSGTSRPQFVLFGSSIVQFGFFGEGWAATLAHLYARKVRFLLLLLLLLRTTHARVSDACCWRDFEFSSNLLRKILTLWLCHLFLCNEKITFTWNFLVLTTPFDTGWYNQPRICWLEYKASSAGSGQSFSQGIHLFTASVQYRISLLFIVLRKLLWYWLLPSLLRLCELVEFRMPVYNHHWSSYTLVAMILRFLTHQDSVLLCLSKNISRIWKRLSTISRFFIFYPFLVILASLQKLDPFMNDWQSLSDTTRIIVLSAPPIDDVALNIQFARRWFKFYFMIISCNGVS